MSSLSAAGPGATPTLLEREHECEAITRALAAATAGTGSIVGLEGAAGMGKTALLAHAARCAADRGMRVLDARAWELERDVAYGVVRQLFEAPLADASNDQRSRWLAGAAGLATPVISAREQVTRNGSDRGPILRGLYWLSANLACEQPLLFIVDDAQWADSASLAFLTHLAWRVEELPILIVYAARTGARPDEALASVAEPGLVPTVLRPALAQRGGDARDPARAAGRARLRALRACLPRRHEGQPVPPGGARAHARGRRHRSR